MDDQIWQTKWLQTEQEKICYYVNQRHQDRPTVLLLHGLSANHTTWLEAAKQLDKMELNCLVPDLRGHGHSDKTKKRNLYRWPVFTGDLNKIIKQENLSQVILTGYSFGGYVALDYAIKYPLNVTGLILISTNHVNPLVYKKINFLTPIGYAFLNLLAWLLFWQKRKEYYYFDQATAQGYWHSTFKGFTTMPLSVNFWMLSEITNLDLRRQIGEIKCPTLIIRSKADPFLSAKEALDMAAKIQGSKIITFQESTHFLASRFQEKIIEVILEFFKEKNIIS